MYEFLGIAVQLSWPDTGEKETQVPGQDIILGFLRSAGAALWNSSYRGLIRRFTVGYTVSMKTRNRTALCFRVMAFVLLALGSVFAQTSHAQDSTDSAVEVISYDDGPHVYWQDDTTAIALYFVDGEFIREVIDFQSGRSFVGLAWDDTVLYTLSPELNTPGPESVEGASRVLALSDIHGEHEYFVEILQNAMVIDSARHWIWGDGHLVIVGDVFDRGDKVNECLWLIYRLEQEAAFAGGAVHFTFGNHELMVLRDDLRYVSEKYLKGISRRSRINYSELYGPDFELGRWLRTKHAAIRINGILFTHGGISPALLDSGYNLTEINERMRETLDLPAAELMFNQRSKFLTGSFGPLWYRGFHYEMENRYQQATSEDIDRVLSYFDVTAVVVGHTGVDSVTGLYDNRVFAVDIPFEDIQCIEALLWENNSFYRVLCSGELREIK